MATDHVASLRHERERLLETMRSLSDEEFEHGRTLCEGWTPRDVLAHVVGVDDIRHYARPDTITVDRGNARAVREGRSLSRDQLLRRAEEVAARPSRLSRTGAALFAGDAAMHHQDVLRGLGLPHELPDTSAPAIYREGLVWSWVFGQKLLRYRVEPLTPGLRPHGRGRVVRGTAEALALWMAGRTEVVSELEFC